MMKQCLGKGAGLPGPGYDPGTARDRMFSRREELFMMRRSRALALLVLSGVALSGLLLIGCRRDARTALVDTTHAAKAQAPSQSAKKIVYWRAPMDPTYISDKPGKSPMGMDLVPVYEGEEGSALAGTTQAATGQASTGARAQGKGSSPSAKKILYWRAPMDPTFISDKPGKSPMGMDLVPVYEGEEGTSGGPTVVIDPVTIQDTGVQTATVKRVPLYRVIRTVGHLDYDEKKLYRVNTKVAGWIERLDVDETGQMVRKGQPLLELYSPELVSTQEEYLLALQNARSLRGSQFQDLAGSAASLVESSRRRLEYWDISDAQIRALAERGTIQKTMTLHAPESGFVVEKMAEEGMRITPGMDLFRIANLSTIWVYAHIYQYDVPWVKVGQPAEMILPYIPGKTYRGRVDYVYPYLDQKTRDVKIRVVFPNPGFELKPQMYANVQIRSQLSRATIAVPNEAIIRSGKRNVAFVARPGGKFEPRDLVLGPEGQDGLVQVLSGLNEGEKVVTSGQFLIDSESRLKEAIQKMLEERKGKASGASNSPGDRRAQAPAVAR